MGIWVADFRDPWDASPGTPAVFADLEEQAIVQITTQNSAAWDSLANFSLIVVIEEEFGIHQIAHDDGDRVVSLESVLENVGSLACGR